MRLETIVKVQMVIHHLKIGKDICSQKCILRQKWGNFRGNIYAKSPVETSTGLFAERTRFELVVQIAPYVGLANRWFQPLTHLSRDIWYTELECKYMIFFS